MTKTRDIKRKREVRKRERTVDSFDRRVHKTRKALNELELISEHDTKEHSTHLIQWLSGAVLSSAPTPAKTHPRLDARKDSSQSFPLLPLRH